MAKISTIIPPRTGILAKLEKMLPKPRSPVVFRPDSLSANITNRCNAACSCCCVKANEQAIPDLTSEEVLSALEQARLLIARQDRQFHIWGGEPFLDTERLMSLLEHATRHDFYAQIATNGFWGADIRQAFDIMEQMQLITLPAQKELNLYMACDDMHNEQEVLNPGNLAVIIALIDKFFSQNLTYTIASLALGSSSSLERLAMALSILESPRRTHYLGPTPCGKGFLIRNIMGLSLPRCSIGYIPPSFSGRCSPDKKGAFIFPHLDPAFIAKTPAPLAFQLAVGLNRQLYMHTTCVSNDILPLGDIREHNIGDIVSAAGRDPIVVSLASYGYAQIYPLLKDLFDVDRWISHLYSSQDILYGLDSDDPFTAHPEICG